MSRRSARSWFSFGIGLGIASCMVGGASAHVAPPRVTQIVHGASAHDVVLATTRGLVFGDPAAGRGTLLCGAAFGVAAGSPYRMAALSSGRLLVASLSGARFSDDRGCSWQQHPTLGQLDVTDLVQAPDAPDRLYVTVFGKGDGGIRVSDDGGGTFRALYRAPSDEFLNTLMVAPSDPTRLYATLSTTDELSRTFVLRSTDGGATWTRSEPTVEPNVLDVSLLAVNPVDPDELFVRVRGFSQSDGDGLLHSRDGGRSFTALGRFMAISGVAFSADGATCFMATGDGLLSATAALRRFLPVGEPERLSYVSVVDRAVLVGGLFGSGDPPVMGLRTRSMSDAGATFERFMYFDEVSAPLTCPKPSTVERDCLLDWIDWSREIRPNVGP